MFASFPLINWFFNVDSSASQSEKTSDTDHIEKFNEKSPTEESNSVVQEGYKNTISSILNNFDGSSSAVGEIRLRKKKEKICDKCKMCMSIADLNAPEDITSSNDSFSEDEEEKRNADECDQHDETNESDIHVDESDTVFAILLNKEILGHVRDAEKISSYVEAIKKRVLYCHNFRYDTRYYWEEVLPLDLNEINVLKINLMTYKSNDIVHYAAIEDSIEIIKINSFLLK